MTATKFTGDGSGLTGVAVVSPTVAGVVGLKDSLGKKADTAVVMPLIRAVGAGGVTAQLLSDSLKKKADTSIVRQFLNGATDGQVWKRTGAVYGWGTDNVGAGTIAGVTVGNGMTGGGVSGTIGVGIKFATDGISDSVPRSDHGHDAAQIKTGILNSSRLAPTLRALDMGVYSGNNFTITAESLVVKHPTYSNYINLNTSLIKLKGFPCFVGEPTDGSSSDWGIMFGKSSGWTGLGKDLTNFYFDARVNTGVGAATIYVSHNLSISSTNGTDNNSISTATGALNLNPQSGLVWIKGSQVLTSDSIFKKDIVPIDSPFYKIQTIRGVYYKFKNDQYPEKHFPLGKQIGVIAQDVEKTLPELVHNDPDGHKAVDYQKLTAVLIEVVKGQQYQIDSLQKQVAEIRRLIKK